MKGRGGSTRRGSQRLDVADALAIIFVIVLLTSTLGGLLVSRNRNIATRAQQWVRVATNHLSLSVLTPNQASAEAPPSTHRQPGN
jgi:uncharacterized membrane protein